MIKSQLDEMLAAEITNLSEKKIQDATRAIISFMADSLASGQRIEIRGFGSFSLSRRPARKTFNPKTREKSFIEEKSIPHFRPGKSLKHDIDASKSKYLLQLDD